MDPRPLPSCRSRCRALLVAGLVLAAAGCRGAPDGPLHVLFVSIDTLRADHLGCYGYERPTSPEIDALARDGHRFESAYTVMATTLPAHVSMFTSLYPAQTGVRANGQRVPDEVETLAERLADAGYRTGGFVSARPLDPSLRIGQGFRVYDAPAAASRPGAETVRRAVQWIDADASAPFFAFVHLYDPHTWYRVDEPAYTRPFGAMPGFPLPPERGFLGSALAPALRTASVNAYDAEVRYADAQLGALLDFLDERGLRRRTLVVLVSDHGETLGELVHRSYAFDHGEFLSHRELRIPLVLWLPVWHPARGPAVHPELVSVLDLAPTLLDLLGLPAHRPMAGRSLTGLLAGEPLGARHLVAERRAGAGSRSGGEAHSVTDGRWHWVQAEGEPEALFDLRSDPGETRNLARSEPGRVEAFRTALETWRRAVDAPLWEPDRELDPELEEALRGLGYVVGDEATR